MDINKHYSIFFGDLANGIILDNAYNIYIRNRYIEYIKDEKINYIYSQDLDMNMVAYFPEIEFLSVPQEAENLQQLYNLKKLKGLEIFASELDKIDLGGFEYLEMLLVRGEPKNINNIEKCKNLKTLSCQQWDLVDLQKIGGIKSISGIEFFFCNKLQSLKGIENFHNLEELCLNFCIRLNEIEPIKRIQKTIKSLRIFDCPKVEDFYVLNFLHELQNLTIFMTEMRNIKKMQSVAFVENMKELTNFATNYKILDNNLKPLQRVKNVEISKFYKDYNLKEKDFIIEI